MEIETYWAQLAYVIQMSAIFIEECADHHVAAKTLDILVTDPIISHILAQVMLGSKHQETCTIYIPEDL